MSSKFNETWGEALLVYRHPRVVGMVFLGFAAGLPYGLVFITLSAWLREAEISLSVIGFLSWVGITYSIKVLWAPVIDRVPLPLLTRLLGRRRGWMLLAQMGVVLGLLGIASTDPAGHILTIAAFALVVAFSSATQDISIDAYRIEAVRKELQGAMAAAYNFGYRMALMVAGAGALYIADFVSWPAAYMTMAALMLVGIVTVLVISEPQVAFDPSTVMREERVVRAMEKYAHLSRRGRALIGWFLGAVVGPFVDFFVRNGLMALVILAFISLYRLTDITLGVMAYPFYIDLGFSKSEIASVTKIYGVFMTIVGAILGGVAVVRFGIMRPLLLGGVLAGLTNLLFAIMAKTGPDLGLFMVTISADNLSSGFAGTVFIAYLSSLCNVAYTATQYALFSSLMSLPGRFLGGFSGVVVDAAGYVDFFLYTALAALPAILLLLFLMRRANVDAPPVAAAEPR